MDSFHAFPKYNAPTLGRVLNIWKPEQSPVALQIPASTLEFYEKFTHGRYRADSPIGLINT
mgnify:CR=1 FL=1